MGPITLEGGAGDAGSPKKDRDDNTPSEIAASSPEMSVQTLDEYEWTSEELEEAKPCNIIEVSEKDIKAYLDEQAEKAKHKPEDTQSDEGEPEAQATSGGYNYPPPGTRHEVFDEYTVWPYRTIGKLFFKRNGTRYVCSAASIGNNAIWTAGH